MSNIPRDKSLDSTLAVLRDGYRFILDRCRHYGSDIFETRLILTRAICTMGEDAAEMFYAGDRFTRRHALPITTLKLLQDFGSVQLLEGAEHRHRKQMFLSLLAPDQVERLAAITEQEWRAKILQWQRRQQIVLFDEVREILCRGVCRWAGVPLAEEEVGKRTRELGEMIEASGSVGPRAWRAMLLRRSAERWMKHIIEKIREGKLSVPEDCPAAVVARHRDKRGELLSLETAAVELINLLRPTVAVGRFIVFVALALHEQPECRRKIRMRDETYTTWFVEEVRRFYPFFPFIAGRVKRPFEWRGRRFKEEEWVLFDVYGTNHDARIHGKPEEFNPERRLAAKPDEFGFVPQGAGDPLQGHRCPGEGATVALMRLAADLLTNAMRYDVPEQDLSLSLARIPALPRSGFVLSNVQALPALDQPVAKRA